MEIRNSCSVADSQEDMGWLCNIDSLISNWKRNSQSKRYAEPRPILQITV